MLTRAWVRVSVLIGAGSWLLRYRSTRASPRGLDMNPPPLLGAASDGADDLPLTTRVAGQAKVGRNFRYGMFLSPTVALLMANPEGPSSDREHRREVWQRRSPPGT